MVFEVLTDLSRNATQPDNQKTCLLRHDFRKGSIAVRIYKILAVEKKIFNFLTLSCLVGDHLYRFANADE